MNRQNKSQKSDGTQQDRVVIKGHVLVYDDDGAGWSNFETEVGKYTRLDLGEVQRHCVGSGNAVDVRIDEIKTHKVAEGSDQDE